MGAPVRRSVTAFAEFTDAGFADFRRLSNL
jgi:hypothetical protein